MGGWQDEHELAPGTICHLREADINQEIYGMPEWLAAMQSVLLNESAILFRRRHYNNGSHAGFIFYMIDAAQKEDDIDSLRTALSQGAGQLPQPLRLCPGWQERRHPADPGQRGGGER